MLGYLQNLFQALDVGSLLAALLRVLAVLLCLTVHETCHGLAAYVLGDPTAKSRHRLSLNPVRHIDWLGLAMMFFVGFGWAKPVPVDPRYFEKPKQGMAVTALAGPVSNLLLAALALGIGKAIYLYAPYTASINAFFEFLLYTLAPLSVGLGLFNLLPIPPLDGSRLWSSLLPGRWFYTLEQYSQYITIGLFVLLFTGVLDGPLSWLHSIVGRGIGFVLGEPDLFNPYALFYFS